MSEMIVNNLWCLNNTEKIIEFDTDCRSSVIPAILQAIVDNFTTSSWEMNMEEDHE